MKNLVLCLLLLMSGAMAQAQIIELEEAKVDYFPDLERGEDGTYNYQVKEVRPGEFAKDAIGFMQKHFDINAFMEEVGNPDWDSYQITFKNGHGYLKADFDKDGKLNKTRQQFKDIFVPANIRNELYRNHKGWTMVKNKYTARGTGEMLDEELYRIEIQKGNETKVLKIDPRTLGTSGVASN